MLLSLDSILQYTVCPFKLTFSTEPAELEPINKLYKLLIHQGLLYLGKNNRLGPNTLNGILNTSWHGLKSELASADSSLYLSIKNRVKQINQNLFSNISELVATDYQTTITFGTVIAAVRIKAVYISSDRVLGFLFEYNDTGYHFTSNTMLSNLYTYVARTVAKQDFNSSVVPEVLVFKTLNGMTYKVETDKTLTKLKPIIHNIIHSVNQKFYYPVSTPTNCNGCSYRNTCEWKQ